MLLFSALIFNRDQQTLIEEREFPQTLRQRVEVKFCRFKDLVIGLETDFCTATIGVSCVLQRACRSSTFITLDIHFSTAPDLQVHPLRESVHHGDADSVQTARNLIGVVVELAPGMKFR